MRPNNSESALIPLIHQRRNSISRLYVILYINRKFEQTPRTIKVRIFLSPLLQSVLLLIRMNVLVGNTLLNQSRFQLSIARFFTHFFPDRNDHAQNYPVRLRR